VYILRIRLKEIIDHQNITIYALSKEIGVTQNNLSKIVKGETTSIKYDILEKLCITLKVTPNDIFEIDYPYPDDMIRDGSKDFIYNFKPTISKPEQPPIKFEDLDEHTKTLLKTVTSNRKLENKLKHELDESISEFIIKLVTVYLSTIKIDEYIKLAFRDYKFYDYFYTGYKVKSYYDKLSVFIKKQLKNKRLLKFLTDVKNIYEQNYFEDLTVSQLQDLQKEVEYCIETIDAIIND
jgi:putative transcriptional regulator